MHTTPPNLQITIRLQEADGAPHPPHNAPPIDNADSQTFHITISSGEYFDPDHQPPLPFQAAEDYARTVMSWAQAPLPEHIVAWRNQAYGPHRLHSYDVFAPPNAHNAPILVFWHGGGWTNGYREYVHFMAQNVTDLGMVLITPSYRLVRDAPLPAALEDCFALLNHIAQNAHTFGANPEQVYLAGHSAGGHLAALTALRYPLQTQRSLPTDALRGCLPISGIMDLHHPQPEPGSLEERVYTSVLAHPDEDAALSPLCWTAGCRMPFVLTCGAQDSPRVQHSNRRMLALLRTQNSPAQLHIEAQTDHFGSHTQLRDATHPWYGRLAELVGQEAAQHHQP